MAGSWNHVWSFFYAPPAAIGRLWPPAGGASGNGYPASEIAVGTGARSSLPQSVGASPQRGFCPAVPNTADDGETF